MDCSGSMSTRLFLLCGAGAALSTFAALAAASRGRGIPLARSVNATMHVVDGASAGSDPVLSVRRTGGGAVINTGAASFWAGVTVAAIASRQTTHPAFRPLIAASVGGLAGLADYGIVPRRLTPGWELPLGKPIALAVVAAMGLGLAAGEMVDDYLGGHDSKG